MSDADETQPMNIGRTRRGRLTWAEQLERALEMNPNLAPEDAEAALLRDALKRYGSHDDDCSVRTKDRCTCGYQDAVTG